MTKKQITADMLTLNKKYTGHGTKTHNPVLRNLMTFRLEYQERSVDYENTSEILRF